MSEEDCVKERPRGKKKKRRTRERERDQEQEQEEQEETETEKARKTERKREKSESHLKLWQAIRLLHSSSSAHVSQPSWKDVPVRAPCEMDVQLGYAYIP